jgi:uroporphyrinogen decarboxylase
MKPFNEFVLSSKDRLALPIAVYPACSLGGWTPLSILQNAHQQSRVAMALQARYQLPYYLTAMNLSAEAFDFGAKILQIGNEIPSIEGSLITTLSEAEELVVPNNFGKYSQVILQTISEIKIKSSDFPNRRIIAGCVGPFSLAARLLGCREALELTLEEPEIVTLVVEKSTQYLIRYIRSMIASGARGLIMAEPTAGLLSPNGLAMFSSPYIKKIAEAVGNKDGFSIILHNCGATPAHLPAILATGLKAFHFGKPMDIPTALNNVPDDDVVVCGNLDPAGVFVRLNAADVSQRTFDLLDATKGDPRFVISSGCDLPAGVSMQNLDAFHETVRDFNYE